MESQSLDHKCISNRLKSFVNRIDTKIYEHLVFNENLSTDKLFELFKNDISEVVSYSKLLNWLSKNYTSEINDFELDTYDNFEDEYEENYIYLSMNELLEIKEDITFYIDKNDGEIIPYIKESRLNILLSENIYFNLLV